MERRANLLPRSESARSVPSVVLSRSWVLGSDAKEDTLETNTQLDRSARGRTGEQVAAAFLADRGYLVLAKNQRTPLGEIDIVCRHQTDVVIVEVKARCADDYGTALEAIGPRKTARLRGAALWWLSERGMFPCPVRFDAVVVRLDGHGLPCSLRHVKDVLGN